MATFTRVRKPRFENRSEEYGRKVPADFPRRAPCKLAFIGDAPQAWECEKNAPFVGPTGIILESGMRAASIDRYDCLLTYVYDEKFEGDDIVREKRRRGSEWPAYHEASLARVKAEIEAANPTVVVPLGTNAVAAFKPGGNISNLRGQPFMGERLFFGVKFFPIFDPDMVRRKYSLFHVFIGDLNRALAEAEIGKHIELPKRLLSIAPTIEEVEAFVDEAAKAPLLSADIET